MSRPQSKEELRAARLRALDKATTKNTENSPSQVASTAVTSSNTVPVPNLTVRDSYDELMKVIYLGGEATEEDLLRWNFDGFCFCINPSFGLKQGHGGPCGILAVVQAELIATLFFTDDLQPKYVQLPAMLPRTELQGALIRALSVVLLRASINNSVTVITIMKGSDNPHIPLPYWNMSDLVTTTFHSLHEVQDYLSENISAFEDSCGCLLFLLSLVMTRGIDKVKSEMDDINGKLIGRFGHCNQELINLLMTGHATSNVFDGQRVLGDDNEGMVMRGVFDHHNIGYLSYLEAMRYCEVGNYLKVPRLPIWVVGSSSHFTTLFSLDKSVNDESISEKLLSTLRRSFKAVDKDECGFVASSSLQEILQQINIHHEYEGSGVLSFLCNPTELSRLRGFLQSDGEIIIWNTFWEVVSRIMMGESLDSIMDSSLPANPSNLENRKRSDSEIARELQDQLNNDPNFDFSSFNDSFSTPLGRKHGIADQYASAAIDTAPDELQELQKRFRSDSELARELQAQWDAEDSLENLGNQTNPQFMTVESTAVASVFPNRPDIETSLLAPIVVPTSSGTIITQPTPQSRTEDNDHILFHYNGLQNSEGCGTLTTIKLVKRGTENSAIGRSVTLGSANATLISNRPLEEVMWTKWTEALIQWNEPNPKID